MGATSAGLLLYRISPGGVVEVLIAHPGGPFWARKDDAAWSVPKGEYLAGEDPLDAAYREFEEEVGLEPPEGEAVFLGELRQPGGKRVSVWALPGDLDVTRASSNTFELEWPRGSGNDQGVPRGRPGRVGLDRSGPAQAREGPGPVPRCAAGGHRAGRRPVPTEGPPRQLRTDGTSPPDAAGGHRIANRCCITFDARISTLAPSMGTS